LEKLEDRTVPATTFVQTNLISDIAGMAQFTDPNMRNPWGIAVNPTGDFWVANAASGTITLYQGDVNGSPISRDTPIITLPKDPNNAQILPTGMVFNTTRDFSVTDPGFNGPAPFFVAGLDGTITAIAPTFAGTTSIPSSQYQTQVVAVTQGAVYTGLAIGSNASGNFLYAANVSAGRIDMFNSTFQLVDPPGGFVDPGLPAGYSPFNVVNINGTLYVTYKNLANPDVGGVVDTYDTNGNFLSRFAQGGNLNAPWAVVQAPANFGDYAGDILVGNFGDGRINVYHPDTGAFLGQLIGQNGRPLAVERLWQLAFGNGKTAGNSAALYFSGGINGESDGLFGSLQPTSSIPSSPSFVNQVYLDLLQRPADPIGLAYFTTLQNNGDSRQDIVSRIESSPEFRALEINGLYTRLLHRSADPSGTAYWEMQLQRGMTIEQVESGIAGSPEYYQTRGGGTVNGYLSALYQDALGRAPDATGQAGFTAALLNGASRADVAAVVFGSDEFRSDLIQGFYTSILHRPAESGAVAYWTATMKNGARDEDVIAGIMGSSEFFANLGGLSSSGSGQTGSQGSGQTGSQSSGQGSSQGSGQSGGSSRSGGGFYW
jgi:uncharacterized protein (TIGR03118 family)